MVQTTLAGCMGVQAFQFVKGHLPKFDDESAKAWLYGKLLVALLTEKIVRHVRTLSPWGHDMQAQHMEALQVRPQPSHTRD